MGCINYYVEHNSEKYKNTITPDKNINNDPQNDIEKDQDAKFNKLIEENKNTFCFLSESQIYDAINNLNKRSGVNGTGNFSLLPGKYVTHQGLVICNIRNLNGGNDSYFVTRNPNVLDTLRESGYSEDKTKGTPFANADLGVLKQALPFLGNFLSSEAVSQENEKLKRNKMVEEIARDGKYMDSDAFKNKFGFSKEEFEKDKFGSVEKLPWN